MTTALIGYTGYVGSTLLRQTEFTDCYNSKNINEIQGKHYSLIVCAGAPAVKWKANQQPAEDWTNLQSLIKNLENVSADEFVLVSTVDVYQVPVNVNEETPIDPENTDPYGKHRFLLEQFARQKFERTRVVRLPGLFGKGLKKNFIYDMLYDNCLHLTHHQSVFQFYDMSRLWDDIQTVRNHKIDLMNFATEPVSAVEVATHCFAADFSNITEKAPVYYDMHTKWSSLFGSDKPYMFSKDVVLAQIKSFVEQERRPQ